MSLRLRVLCGVLCTILALDVLFYFWRSSEVSRAHSMPTSNVPRPPLIVGILWFLLSMIICTLPFFVVCFLVANCCACMGWLPEPAGPPQEQTFSLDEISTFIQ
jgi:hypothetical protein